MEKAPEVAVLAEDKQESLGAPGEGSTGWQRTFFFYSSTMAGWAMEEPRGGGSGGSLAPSLKEQGLLRVLTETATADGCDTRRKKQSGSRCRCSKQGELVVVVVVAEAAAAAAVVVEAANSGSAAVVGGAPTRLPVPHTPQ